MRNRIFFFIILIYIRIAQEENAPENEINNSMEDKDFDENHAYKVSNADFREKKSQRPEFLSIWLNAMRGFLADDMMNLVIADKSEEVPTINFFLIL